MRRLRTPALRSLALLGLALLASAAVPLAGLAHEPGAIGSQQIVAAGPAVTVSGSVHVIYGDAPPGPGSHAAAAVVLSHDQGGSSELVVDEAVVMAHGGLRALNGRHATVSGVLSGGQPASGGGHALMVVHAIQVNDGPAALGAAGGGSIVTAAAVTGARPWVTVLCRFADSAGTTPRPVSYFNDLLLGGTAAGLDQFWREVSFNNVSIAGSTVAGWYTLPSPRASYLSGGYLDFTKALQDCTAAAEASVYFPSYTGINLAFNAELDGYAWGGSSTVTRNGVTRSYSVTWLPPWGYNNQGVMAHEMGHGFGLPHSSGSYAATYDSRWDVMSGIWGNCPPYDSTFGCVGVHTIAYHKDMLGWIPGSQKFVPSGATAQTIELDALEQLTSSGKYLMAQIPIAGSASRFYTVEARRLVSYDAKLPGQAVIIHRVDTTRLDRDAQVVDTDGNGNPNDAGAMWLPGETFVDSANNISVAVNASTTTGFRITVSSASGGGGGGGNPVPTLGALSPTSATVGGAALTLTVTGSNFVAGAVVKWNNADRATTFVSSTELRAGISAGDIATVGTASVKVSNPAPGGGLSSAATFTIAAADCTDPTKFKGEYFTNTTLTGTPALVRCDGAVDFAWTGAPAAGLPTDKFSVRWTKTVGFTAGTYTFTTLSDDGVRLYVDDVLVIDNWTDHGVTANTATRTLTAGNHVLRMHFYENMGGALARLTWASANAANLAPAQPAGWSDRLVVTTVPGTTTSATTLTTADTLYVDWAVTNTGNAAAASFTTELWVDGVLRNTWTSAGLAAGQQQTVLDWPLGQLGQGTHVLLLKTDAGGSVGESDEADNQYSKTITVASAPSGCLDPTKFKGEYFANMTLAGTPALVRCDDAVDFAWVGAPTSGLPADKFSVRWTKTVSFTAGTYTFTTLSDDGVRLYIDDVLVIDNWTDHGVTANTATRTLTAGNHALRMHFYENMGGALARLTWAAVTGPNLAPAPPAGWSDRIVVATAPGATTDAPALTSADTLYVSWAVVNGGGSATAASFTTELYVDGALRQTWTTPAGLAAGGSVTGRDFSLGALAAGTHTLRLKTDAGGAITETNEGDNEYTRTVTVSAPPSGCTDSTKFTGEYFANMSLSGTPTVVRCDDVVDFAWTGAPSTPSGFPFAAGLPADRFSARWTKTVTFAGGAYTFTTVSDDGVRLYVDGVLVISNWTNHPPTTDRATVTLAAGTHTIRMEYYEDAGGARAQLTWAAATLPNITPTQPAGWSDKVVVATSPGLSTDSPGLTASDALYLSWAVANTGGAATASAFTTELYVDGALRQTWTTPAPLAAGATVTVRDALLGTLGAGTHTLRIKTDSGGVLGESAEGDNEYTRTVTIGSVPSGCTDPTKFTAEYFTNTLLQGAPALIRCDAAVSFAWTGAPAAGLPADRFSVRWTKTETFAAGTYTFTTVSDDGVRLYVDNVLVINNWTDHAPTTNTATRTLSAGAHTIRMEYYENYGGALAQLSWAPAVVTGCADPAKFRGEYYSNASLQGTPALVRCDDAVNFAWTGAPAAGLPADRFSVRWTRTLTLTAGDHTFSTVSDDGVRLYLDDELIINNWTDHGPTLNTANVSVGAGDHTVRLEYYENLGGALVQLGWTRLP